MNYVQRTGRIGGLLLFPAFLMVILAGCGSVPSVSGKVTYKGKDLNMGSVHLVGPDGTKTLGAIALDGTYRVIDPPVGLCKVGVEVKPPPKIAVAPAKEKNKSVEKSAYIEPVMIPGTFADPQKSGLTADIKGGTTTHNIELK